MRIDAVVLGALLLIGAGSWVASSASPDDAQAIIRQQVEAAEQSVGKAFAAKDFAALEKLWSPQMLVNSPGNRILDRDQVFGAIRGGLLNYEKMEGTVESFRVYGDVAIEMGHEVIVPGFGSEAGKTFVRRYTNVWQRTGESWVQIARQATYTSDTRIYQSK